MRYLAQAFLALAVLVGLPMAVETPESLPGQIAAGIGALILAGLAFRGVVGFVNSRKPKRYLDSVMPDRPPRK